MRVEMHINAFLKLVLATDIHSNVQKELKLYAAEMKWTVLLLFLLTKMPPLKRNIMILRKPLQHILAVVFVTDCEKK